MHQTVRMNYSDRLGDPGHVAPKQDASLPIREIFEPSAAGRSRDLGGKRFTSLVEHDPKACLVLDDFNDVDYVRTHEA